MKPSLNGIQKTSPVFLWISALSVPAIRRALGKTLKLIFINFFGLQFQTVLKPSIRPVVNVDHPLDKSIPFVPGWVGLYNTFTVFWMKSAGWLYREFGNEALDDIGKFVHEIGLLYEYAGRVYSKCQSTTNRPGVIADFNFIVIHLFDPHLHCVPSLHVMVCAYTSFMTDSLIEKYADDPSRYQAERDWVFKNSIEIIESVLLVKQHSVNCIPAGYFMNTALFPGFREKWAERSIAEMFKDDPKGLDRSDEVMDYIKKLYDSFLEKLDSGRDEAEILLEFLAEYAGTDEVEIGR